VGVESSEAESFWLHAAIEQGTTDRNLEHRKFYTETKMFFTVSDGALEQAAQRL